MISGEAEDLATCNYVGGTKAEFAKNVVQGASEALMLYAGSQANQQSVLTMESEKIVLALGNPVTGPRIEMAGGVDPHIMLRVGERYIFLEQHTIQLFCNVDIVLNEEDVKITAGSMSDSSVRVDQDGIYLNSVKYENNAAVQNNQ